MPALDPHLAGTDQSLSADYVASVLPDLLAHYQVAESTLLARAGLPSSMLAQPGQLIPLMEVMRLFTALLELTGDAGLGFEIGKRVRPRSYQVLGYIILSSTHLGQAIERLVRFERLSGKLGETRLFKGTTRLALDWQSPLAGEPARFITEAAITGWVAFIRPLLPAGLAPLNVYFSHSAPHDRGRYEHFFQAPVVFDAGGNGVELEASLWQVPLNSADPGLSALMEREARELLADYQANTNLPSALRAEMYRQLADGEPSLESVAPALGLSVRALQARLRKQGLGFQDVLDRLRQGLAELYLQDPGLSLTDIALLLGFAESSSFTRAFRRWRGLSPNQWRQRQ